MFILFVSAKYKFLNFKNKLIKFDYWYYILLIIYSIVPIYMLFNVIKLVKNVNYIVLLYIIIIVTEIFLYKFVNKHIICCPNYVLEYVNIYNSTSIIKKLEDDFIKDTIKISYDHVGQQIVKIILEQYTPPIDIIEKLLNYRDLDNMHRNNKNANLHIIKILQKIKNKNIQNLLMLNGY